MKKLNFLKAIVDFVCIMNYIAIPFLILFLGFVLISDEPLGIPVNINGNKVTVIDLESKIALIFLIIYVIIVTYCLYIFRKILCLFQLTRIFDVEVITGFKKIGFLLVISSLLLGISTFILGIYNASISFEIGFNPFVMILVMGLFFMVLSEVFLIGKNQKEENELTI